MSESKGKTWWHDLAPGVFRLQHPEASVADIHRIVNASARIVGQRPMTYAQVYHDLRKSKQGQEIRSGL